MGLPGGKLTILGLVEIGVASVIWRAFRAEMAGLIYAYLTKQEGKLVVTGAVGVIAPDEKNAGWRVRKTEVKFHERRKAT